jgi:hypothetical protein
MPAGIAGDISRPSTATVEAQVFGATPFPAYGIAAKASAGKVIPVAAQNDFIYGFLVRPFPITGSNPSDPTGTAVPPLTGNANILRRGYFSALVQAGGTSCALGSGVFIRGQSASGAQVLGGIEGVTSGNNYQVTPTTAAGQAYFTSPVDAYGIAEIGFNI